VDRKQTAPAREPAPYARRRYQRRLAADRRPFEFDTKLAKDAKITKARLRALRSANMRIDWQGAVRPLVVLVSFERLVSKPCQPPP